MMSLMMICQTPKAVGESTTEGGFHVLFQVSKDDAVNSAKPTDWHTQLS